MIRVEPLWDKPFQHPLVTLIVYESPEMRVRRICAERIEAVADAIGLEGFRAESLRAGERQALLDGRIVKRAIS